MRLVVPLSTSVLPRAVKAPPVLVNVFVRSSVPLVPPLMVPPVFARSTVLVVWPDSRKSVPVLVKLALGPVLEAFPLPMWISPAPVRGPSKRRFPDKVPIFPALLTPVTVFVKLMVPVVEVTTVPTIVVTAPVKLSVFPAALSVFAPTGA